MHSAVTNRLTELLAGEAAGELSEAERAELQAVTSSSMEGNDLMRVAALAQVAFLEKQRIRLTRMPPALGARLRATASSWCAGVRPQHPTRHD